MKQTNPTARVLISMPEKFLFEIDKIANEENLSRSKLIREALRRYMNENNMINKLKADLRRYMNKNNMINKLKADNNAGILEELLG